MAGSSSRFGFGIGLGLVIGVLGMLGVQKFTGGGVEAKPPITGPACQGTVVLSGAPISVLRPPQIPCTTGPRGDKLAELKNGADYYREIQAFINSGDGSLPGQPGEWEFGTILPTGGAAGPGLYVTAINPCGSCDPDPDDPTDPFITALISSHIYVTPLGVSKPVSQWDCTEIETALSRGDCLSDGQFPDELPLCSSCFVMCARPGDASVRSRLSRPTRKNLSKEGNDDDRILAAMDAGERRQVLELMMRTHGSAIFRFCLQLLRNREDAEDVQQTVFVEAYRDIGRFRHRSSVGTWLFGIARHRCLDLLKSRKRKDDPLVSRDAEDTDIAAASEAASIPVGDALRFCLGRMQPGIREAVLLRYQVGMSYVEMSQMLAQKEATLQARVARSLPGLRRCLAEQGARP